MLMTPGACATPARFPKVDFHIEDVGEGRPILFIHAGVADSRMWEDQLGLDGLRTIAFDKRGFGSTAFLPEPFSNTTDAITVLDQLEVDTAVVVGCSMGGATALNLAIEHPDRMDGLVLVGAYPSGWIPPGGFEESKLEEEAELAAEQGDLARVVEIDLEMWLIGYGRAPEDVDSRLIQKFREMDRIPVETAAARTEQQTGFERRLNDHLDEIDLPTLVMVGAHDEPLLVDAAHYLASRISDGDAVVIPGAAHLPSMEQPDVFNRELLAFLDRI